MYAWNAMPAAFMPAASTTPERESSNIGRGGSVSCQPAEQRSTEGQLGVAMDTDCADSDIRHDSRLCALGDLPVEII